MFGRASRVVCALGFVASGLLLAAPTVCGAQQAPAPDDALRLEALLHAQRDRGETLRLVGGPVQIAVGLGVGSVGAWAFGVSTNDQERALGIGTLSLGVLFASFGAVVLAVDTTPEDRWQRWLRARAQGVSPYDVAEFVGELRAEARRTQLERAVAIASGIAMLLTGAATTSLSLSLLDAGFRTTFEVTGIALGLGGALVSLLAWLIEPDNVRELRELERGGVPSPATPRPTVSPVVGPGTAGLALAGFF